MEFRVQFLEKLLAAQKKIRREGPDPAITLILDEEVREIQRIWRAEQGDWRNTAYGVYEKVLGEKLDETPDDAGSFGGTEQAILEEACTKTGVPAQLVSRLLNAERDHQGMTRHSRIFPKINAILGEEWRDDLGEIVEDSPAGAPGCQGIRRGNRLVLIRQVTLNDCGAYAGRHAFNFATDQGRPVILVGGLNGGGKTTLFESILLCLYGMTYARLTRKAYERRLLQMVHRRRDNEMAGEERRTSVAVEFTLSQAGHLTEYMVESPGELPGTASARSWS